MNNILTCFLLRFQILLDVVISVSVKIFSRKLPKSQSAHYFESPKFLRGGDMPAENRGANNTSHKLLTNKEEVRNFLRKLSEQQSHCGVNKSRRIYIGCNLNISKLYKQYQKAGDQQTKRMSFCTFKIFLQRI